MARKIPLTELIKGRLSRSQHQREIQPVFCMLVLYHAVPWCQLPQRHIRSSDSVYLFLGLWVQTKDEV